MTKERRKSLEAAPRYIVIDALIAAESELSTQRDKIAELESFQGNYHHATKIERAESADELSTCRAALESAERKVLELDAANDQLITDATVAEARAKRYREAIDGAPCADNCESNNDKCAVCGGKFDEHPVASDCGKPCEEFELNACDCWKSKALADPPAKPEVTRPKIICLCGSTRFIDTWINEYQRLSDAGNIVLTVARMPPRPSLQFDEPELKIRLDELHKRKIDLSDEVYVLNVGGYIGSSTKGEIEYAIDHGKPIVYMEDPELTAKAPCKTCGDGPD